MMIKVYETGKLTPLLTAEEAPGDLQISCPHGQGLKISSQREGNIVFLAGGTGFYPYMDIIDLLFKQKVYEEKLCSERIRSKILDLNKVIREPILEAYTFLLMVAVTSIEDLHPMSLYQINVLCGDRKKFRCVFRLKDKQE